jgi:hypothetical protein
MGRRRTRRSVSALATVAGGSNGTEDHPNDMRATASETAYGCTGGKSSEG